MNTAKLTFSV